MRVAAALAAVLILTSSVQAQDAAAPPVRDVTPPGFTPGPAVDGPLIREAVPPPPPEPARWRRFHLPETADAATFVVDGGLIIRVSGVTPPAIDATCRFADGEAWPCGRSALHALRMFLRGRAIECYFPPVSGGAMVIAPCRVGETDVGLWLLASGWAQPNDLATDDYVGATAEAQCARLGIWQGEARPDYCDD